MESKNYNLLSTHYVPVRVLRFPHAFLHLVLARMLGGRQCSHFSYEGSEVQRLSDGLVDTQVGNGGAELEPRSV